MDKPASVKWKRWAIGFLAVALYRNSRLFAQILNPPTLPSSYSALGNCSAVHHPSKRFDLCEDFVEWSFTTGSDHRSRDSRLVVSCDPGRKEWNQLTGPLWNPNPKGDLWILNPHTSLEPDLPKKVVLQGFPEDADFHPFGIQVIQPAPGKPSYLFVINHRRQHATIEFFLLPLPVPGEETVTAKHVKTLTHPAFVSPNSLALASPSSFYVTNDHRMSPRILPSIFGELVAMVETVFALPLGWVDRVDLDLSKWEQTGNRDGITFEVSRAISNIPFPNGVAISQDGQELAVASSTNLEVYLYDLDQSELKFQNTVQMPFHPDNLRYGADRTVYIAGHPSFIPMLMVARGLSKRGAPSWVLQMSPSGGEGVSEEKIEGVAPILVKSTTHDLKTLYQSDGVLGYGSSSTALIVEGERKLFVTGLFDTGMLRCGD